MINHNKTWGCISNCGACCYLEPEHRQEAIQALNPSQKKIYLKMVGEDGWCINYNSSLRTCSIYNKRPDFCRVSNLSKLYNLNNTNFDEFAIQCCLDQIRSIYGGRSIVMKKYKHSIRTQRKGT